MSLGRANPPVWPARAPITTLTVVTITKPCTHYNDHWTRECTATASWQIVLQTSRLCDSDTPVSLLGMHEAATVITHYSRLRVIVIRRWHREDFYAWRGVSCEWCPTLSTIQHVVAIAIRCVRSKLSEWVCIHVCLFYTPPVSPEPLDLARLHAPVTFEEDFKDDLIASCEVNSMTYRHNQHNHALA